MSAGALQANASHAFYPKINRRSRILAHGPLSVQERQEHDRALRESHYQELVAKVERERHRMETFTPTINRRVKSASVVGKRSEFAKKNRVVNPEETFHPVINARSQRMVANGAWQCTQQHSQAVRQRVQGLWRAHAGAGNGEITLGGVYAALKELGLQPPSPMVDKFLQALGINEAAGLRCVAYDRFIKVFTVVLRAALVASSCPSDTTSVTNQDDGEGVEDDNDVGGTNSDISSSARAANYSVSGTQRALRVPLSASATSGNGSAAPTDCGRRGSVRRGPLERLSCLSENDAHTHDGSNSDDGSNGTGSRANSGRASGTERRGIRGRSTYDPSPTMMTRGTSLARRTRGASLASLGLNQSGDGEITARRTTKARYNPLEGCTFTPVINRKNRLASSARRKESVETQSSRKGPTMVRKSREEQELEKCTFAPNTARFHKNRDSLAWWTREPFVDATLEPTSSSSFQNTVNTTSEANNITTTALDEPFVKSSDCRVAKNSRTSVSRAAPVPLSSGFDKAVQRMVSARKKCRSSFEEMLRSSSLSEESTKPLQPTVVEPFMLHAVTRQLQREQRKPVLYVDVDLPSGRTGRIGVHRGDRAEDLARDFSQAYGLNEELCERLESLLTVKLNELARKSAVRTLWL